MLFPGALHVIHTEPTTELFGQLPLLLFPTYLVPFAAAVHFMMLDAVRRATLDSPDALDPITARQ